MGDGWLMDPEDRWTYRFHRGDMAWVRDPKVFVDMGRAMSDGSPALRRAGDPSDIARPISTKTLGSLTHAMSPL